jgi:hypothetical protein
VVLAALFALLVVLPRVLPAALASGKHLTRAALARAAPRPAAAPATALPEATPPVATPAADLPSLGAGAPVPAGAVTPRAAADAIAQGRCAAAVALYAELSRKHPELEVYREAARILQLQYPGCAEGE